MKAADVLLQLMAPGAPVRGVRIQGQRITGDFDWTWQKIPVPLELVDCIIDEPVLLDHAQITGLSVVGCRMPGIFGEDMSSASVVRIERCAVETMIGLNDATINGPLVFSGTTVQGKHLPELNGLVALLAERLQVSGAVRIDKGFVADGAVMMSGAQIRGGLYGAGASLTNAVGACLSASDAVIEGNVLLNQGFRGRGQISLARTIVAGDLDLSSALLEGNEGRAIVVDDARIGGSAFFRNDFVARGEVRLRRARIEGRLVFTRARFENPGSVAVRATDVEVGNSAALVRCEAYGDVFFDSARIAGDLDCSFATLTDAFRARGMTVEGVFRWRPEAVQQVDVRDAVVSELDDDVDSWPKDGLRMDGFTYARMSDRAPRSPVQRIEWLRSNNGYTPQIYRQLAKAYRADGRDREAKMVEMAQEDDLLRLGDLAGPTRFGRRLLGWIIGHGYRPGRAAWALVVLYALTLGLVWVGAQNDAFIQVGQTAPQSSVTSSHCADAYPCFSPTAFAR